MPYYIKKNKKAPKPTPWKKDGTKKKRKPNLVAKLDKVFSLFIRLRDSKPFGYKAFRCISCGKIKPFEQADCGHYWSRTHMSTRFDEENCHNECASCNRFVADHLIGYRENLIRKIGQQRYDLLQYRAHQSKKWSDFELEQLIKYYSALVNLMEDERRRI